MLWSNARGKLAGKSSGTVDQSKGEEPYRLCLLFCACNSFTTPFHAHKLSFRVVLVFLVALAFALLSNVFFLEGKKKKKKSGNGLWASHLISHSWQTGWWRKRGTRGRHRILQIFQHRLSLVHMSYVFVY